MNRHDSKPLPPQTIGWQHERYKGRDFFGDHAHDLSELAYLRDLCRWQARRLRGYESWERSVNEALNSGDGAYRP
jgi:hypothetical protein